MVFFGSCDIFVAGHKVLENPTTEISRLFDSVSSCGLRFVEVGRGPDPSWVEELQAVRWDAARDCRGIKIRCSGAPRSD